MPSLTKMRLVSMAVCFLITRNSQLCGQASALREAIREYEANKWKTIGQKVGKPAKVESSRMNVLSGKLKRARTGLRTLRQRAFQEFMIMQSFGDQH